MTLLPSQIIDLSTWKLTLPTGAPGKPTEMSPKELATYVGGPWCKANAAGNGVSFGAPVNGVTTSGSKNSRGELREMTKAGKNASWAGKTGWHCLTVVESFDHLPNTRTDGGTAGLVGAQIHDAKKDWIVFRLEGSKLWLTNGDNTHYKLATDKYVPGTPYVAQFVVYGGIITAYYNGAPVAVLPASKLKGAYFKAGAYTQANCSNSKPCSAENYGQTTIYSVSVLHADKPGVRPTPSVPGTVPLPPADPPPVPDPTPAPVPVPVTGTDVIIALRHGEKPSDPNSHVLSPAGQKRAQGLAALFTADPLRDGLYRVDEIVASEGTTASLRPFQTVKPLADLLHEVEVTRWAAADASAAGKEIAKWHGVTLVCWAHAELPDVVKAFGKVSPTPPKSWPDSRYDVFWIFKRQADGSWKFSQMPQMVLPGDQSTVIK